MARVGAFPWSDLPNASRFDGALAAANRLALRVFDLDAMGPALAELLGAELQGTGVASQQTQRTIEQSPRSARVLTPNLDLVLDCDPELVAFALSRLLGRPARLASPSAPLPPALIGAWHALLMELGRRLSRGEPPLLRVPEAGERHGPGMVLRAWLRLDGRSFRVDIVVIPGSLPEPDRRGDVSVPLRLVVARCQLPREEVTSLRVGDALFPGAGWLDAAGAEKVAIAPGDERGFRLQIDDRVRYVGPAHLPFDLMLEQPPMEDATKESVIAETPVVIRVEMGTITLSAREWMSLAPGDVLSCGVPPKGPVVLRSSGREIARGELVTVDGELGVRITAVVGADDATQPAPAPEAI